MKTLHFFIFLLITTESFAQLPKSAAKLEGSWRYASGEGVEHWSAHNDGLEGSSYRMNKLGDSVKVESFTINNVNNRLVYSLTSHNVVGDSLVDTKRHFIGGKRKLEFVNIEEVIPYSVSYRFGLFTSNKLIISVRFGINDKPTKFKLARAK